MGSVFNFDLGIKSLSLMMNKISGEIRKLFSQGIWSGVAPSEMLLWYLIIMWDSE